MFLYFLCYQCILRVSVYWVCVFVLCVVLCQCYVCTSVYCMSSVLYVCVYISSNFFVMYVYCVFMSLYWFCLSVYSVNAELPTTSSIDNFAIFVVLQYFEWSGGKSDFSIKSRYFYNKMKIQIQIIMKEFDHDHVRQNKLNF